MIFGVVELVQVPFTCCKVVDCRSVVKVCYMKQPPSCKHNRKHVNKDFYIDGEGYLQKYRHSEVKGDNIQSVKRSFARLRDLINCNYTLPEDVLMLTLTYADFPSMKKVSNDMRKLHMTLRKDYDFRYIYVVEKQARGSWHVHDLLFFDYQAPWLDVPWNRGFYNVTRVGSFQGVKNLGAYICAYLTDDVSSHGREKNSRLMNYKSNIHLYRCSSNVIRPEIIRDVSPIDVMECVEDYPVIYNSKKSVETEGYVNDFYYVHYQRI